MLEPKESPVKNFGTAQATELSVLVDLEARWENLKKPALPPRNRNDGSTLQDLHGKQKAYDAFRAKLVAYNNRYKPAHIPELLLNTPIRLALWCRTMRDLYLRVEHDGNGHCPVELLEKAHRWAARMAARLNLEPLTRSTPPATLRAAIDELESLALWCDGIVGLGHAGRLDACQTLPTAQSA